jgi:acyl carrier protein
MSEKLDAIFRVVFKLPADAPVSDLAQGVNAAWDSLAHTLLVAGVESEFGIAIDAGDSMELTSYGAMAKYLEKQGL